MGKSALKRWGELLDVLSQLSDVERQLVSQGMEPSVFVPDRLLERWYSSFQGGYGMSNAGFSDDIVSVLIDFDTHMDDLVEVLPSSADDKEHYIQHNELWQIVRELADWTLTRIAFLSTPEQVSFENN